MLTFQFLCKKFKTFLLNICASTIIKYYYGTETMLNLFIFISKLISEGLFLAV